MSTAISTLHVLPVGGGEWAIAIDQTAGASSVHPTRAQAVARAWELVSDLAEAEVVVHRPDGRVQSTLTIRGEAPMEDLMGSDIDESDDPAARAEALRITPSNARLKAGIRKYPPPQGDFDHEEMAY